MDVSLLRTFVEVMQRGSFAAAARHLDLDPSSVSRAVAVLEADLGVRLFQRTTRRLAPTEAGAVYYDRVRPLVSELARAHAEAHDVTTAPVGLLRVTTSVAFGIVKVVPLLPKLRAAYPALEIELLLTDTTIDLIAERVDVAIRLSPSFDSSLIGLRLMPTRYRVCASPAYLRRHNRPRDPQALEIHDCLRLSLPGYRSRWRFRSVDGALAEVDIRGSIVISNPLALHQAATAGLGPALLADWIVADDLRAGRLIDLFSDYDVTATDFDTAAWILYPSRAYTPRKVRTFIDFLRLQLAD